jgi:hypothetical protein
LSLVASGLQEVVQAVLGLRGKNLRNGIKQLLNDPAISDLIRDGLAKTGMAEDDLAKKNLADALYSHPLVAARSALHGPSYLKPATFALALMDILRALPGMTEALKAAQPAGTVQPTGTAQRSNLWDSARAIVDALPDHSPVKRQLLLVLDNTELGKAKEAIESWFMTTMDRVEGWFKRSTLTISVVIGIAIALGGNVDAIGLTQYLADSPEARRALVLQAEQSMDAMQQTVATAKPCEANAPADDPCMTRKVTVDAALKTFNESMATASSTLSAGMLPFGWSDETMPATPLDWLSRVIGWLLTAIAISVGAPFWFSMLQKLMSFRASGANPKEQEKEQQEQQAQQAAKT